MRRHLPLFLLLAGCSRPESKAAQPPAELSTTDTTLPEWGVSTDRIGVIPYGLTLASLNEMLRDSMRTRPEPGGNCAYVRPASAPPGVSFMVLGDTVARVDVDSTGVLTLEGRGVGDSEQQVLETYRGRVKVEPHKYTGPTGHYLVVTGQADSLHRIIFETDGAHVLRYRAGILPAVAFVEGCS